MEQTVLNGSLKRTHEESRGPGSSDGILPRPKRPKSSKACNACRKQKSRCERLAGDLDACHRCTVIGISCVFDADPPTENIKSRKPRQLLPRSDAQSASPVERLTPRTSSPDTARLHALADTTEMMSRPIGTATNTNGRDSLDYQSTTPSSKAKSTLSPETLSTVESTLFPSPREPTSEAESARFRADWRRWAAPLTLLKTLVRRNRPSPRPMNTTSQRLVRPAENGTISAAQERRLKEHFRLRYLPWLPAVKFARDNTPSSLDDVSPFLTTVICATAARTLAEVSETSMENLRSLALLHVGQVFSNPAAHHLVDSLYALLILILWPLDAADDVVLLLNGAKQLANVYERSRPDLHGGKPDELDLDHTRLWYTICASETILNLGTGSPASPPAMEDLVERLGGASDLALDSGCTSDVLIILQTSLHRIVAAAMGEKGPQDLLKRGNPAISGRESLLHYISTVHMILTRLGEWDIEFHAISAECEGPDAVFYAVLEIEYHYLHLMLATHCILTLCHAYPLVSAPDEVKFALWSWGITGNKSAHAAVRLFNVFARNSGDGNGPLASAPDRMFAMMVVAVMLILRHQVAAYEYGRRRGVAEPPPAGFTKQAQNAIRKAAERMGTLGRGGSAEHAAGRYVEIIEALLRIWDEKRAQKTAPVAGHTCELPRESHAHLPVPEPMFNENVGSMQMDMDLNLFGGDVFSDSVFPWDGIGSLDWANAGGQ